MELTPHTPGVPLGFLEKLRVLAACGVAVLLLWTLGWRLAEPVDPRMAVTLTHSGRAVVALWPGLAVLTVVSAAIGTAIVGRRLPEAGALAAAVGLGALSLRGGSMQMLLAYHADEAAGPRRALMWSMALDCLLWTAVMAAAWVSVAAVRHWLWGGPPRTPDAEPVKPEKTAKTSKAAPPAISKPRLGWPALAVTTVVALLVIWSTIARTPVAGIARGQVIASVAGGLYLGALAGRYFTRVTDPTWYVLAAPAAGLIGYIVGLFSSDMGWAQGNIWQPYALLAITPPHDLVRPLPVEYVAVGIIGALSGFWTAERMEHAAELEGS